MALHRIFERIQLDDGRRLAIRPESRSRRCPHSSNWDGFNMLAAVGYSRINLHLMGKQELIDGPFGWYLKRRSLKDFLIARPAGYVTLQTPGHKVIRINAISTDY